MTRRRRSVPTYRKHSTRNQAFVELSGERIYLGRYGSKASEVEYDRLVGEWLANNRQPVAPAEPRPITTVTHVLVAYCKFAQTYYVKNGELTREYGLIREVCKVVRRLYGKLPANRFGPKRLKACREHLIRQGLSREFINKQCQRVVRCFKWAAEEELVPARVHLQLKSLAGLRKGRTAARDYDRVLPVPEDVFQRTLAHLSPIVADMCQLQRLSGARPGEVCELRPCDVDRSRDVWLYVPQSHKTEHHDHERVIPLGPRAQEILRPYLLRRADAFCFSPIDTDRWLREQRAAARVTPLSCGNRAGTNRKSAPAKRPGTQYTTGSYRRAIHRACDSAGVARWSPNRIRHSAGSEVRAKFGLEASQVMLGHKHARVTEVYAERNLKLAVNVAREVG